MLRLPDRGKAAAVATAALAACASPASTSSATNSAATVGVAKTRLGAIIVDSRGRSLYYYVGEPKGSIVCTSSFQGCTTLWPPLMTTGRPHAGPGVRVSLLGTIHRTRPTGNQVTYSGHPLYRYEYDKKPGDVNGQAEYDAWYVLSPKGKPITKK